MTCWHCNGTGKCACIACYEKGLCLTCSSTAMVIVPELTIYEHWLTPEEYVIAVDGGRKRFSYDTRMNFRAEESTARAARNLPRRERDDVLGAIGELAYAIWKAKKWQWDLPPLVRKGQIKAADFDGNKDIKTIYRDTGARCLLLQKRDPDDRIYILARAQIRKRNIEFLGWLYGHEGKIKSNWGDRAHTGRPCYWVDQAVLHSLSTIPQ